MCEGESERKIGRKEREIEPESVSKGKGVSL